jgi:hypothetical protein
VLDPLGPLLTHLGGIGRILGTPPLPPPSLTQLFVDHLLNPVIPILQVLTLFFGVFAGVHAIASHHGEESAALLLVKPVTLTLAVEGFLVVMQNAGSLATGGGLGF